MRASMPRSCEHTPSTCAREYRIAFLTSFSASNQSALRSLSRPEIPATHTYATHQRCGFLVRYAEPTTSIGRHLPRSHRFIGTTSPTTIRSIRLFCQQWDVALAAWNTQSPEDRWRQHTGTT